MPRCAENARHGPWQHTTGPDAQMNIYTNKDKESRGVGVAT